MLLRPALTWISFALLTAVGLGSCVRAEKLDYRIAKATCDLRVECGDYPDVRTCMDLTYVEQPETYLDAALDAGRLDYDSAQAYRCVRAIKKLKCHRGEDESEVLEDCQGIVSGAVEPEQPCMLSDECRGELSVCGFNPTCTDECCPGACRFIPGPFPAGEPCDMGERCESGTYCKFNPDDESAVCTELPGEGDPCEEINYGNSDTCVDDSFCNEDLVCEKPREDGAACSDDEQCRGTSQCDDEENVCVARAKKGDPCESDGDCLRGDHICHEDACIKPLDVGDECGEWTRRCADYAVCEGNACAELGKVGDACDVLGVVGVPCYPSLSCDQGTCAKPEAPMAMDFCPVPE